MTITTKTGKTFESDMVAENPSPPRLYLHILGTPLGTLAGIFTSPEELPIDGHPDFVQFQSISVTPDGVNVTLKKTGT